MELLQERIYGADPGCLDPLQLRCSYQVKLANSLKIHLEKISQSVKIDLSRQVQRLKDLDLSRRFSPQLYAIYVGLKEAYQRKDLEALLDGVQFFNNLTGEEFYTDQRRYGSLLGELWEIPLLKESRASSPCDDLGQNLAPKVQMYPLIHWDTGDFPPVAMTQAEKALKSLDEPLFEEYSAYVSWVKLYSCRSMFSLSSPRFFGVLYMRLAFPEEDPFLFYLETIVHELSHLHLFVLMSEDPVILNREDELFVSPLRPDKRPMLGTFHATFVLARIVRILRRHCAKKPEDLAALKILKNKERFFLEGLQCVEAHARFTQKGKELFATMERCAFE